MKAVRRKDIAIIGLACRFPGAADPRAFWQLLQDGREIVGALADAADFDAGFFNVSPREAAAMDPRQRLALELTWELCEDAYLVPKDIRGQPIAVYLGAMNDDYALLTTRHGLDQVGHHAFSGLSRGMIANRVSFCFDLRGPSLTVDSGQSSSLVAVHLAAEALRAGTASMAVAGGVQLNLAAEIESLEREFGALSPSGHTYAFDARADGYVRSDGAALVLLKPLGAALDDGNRVHAIISGSAVGNAGGETPGLTVPSATAQADVIRLALADAGLDPAQVDYVEAHGTGTRVGDPIEVSALAEVFGPRRRPLTIGSVKTNVGHTGAASGITGLLKTVLAVANTALPASLNFDEPAGDVAGAGLRVNTALAPWTDDERVAGVSSFGMGGTNAHVIVEPAPKAKVVAAESDTGVMVPWVVSARSAEALSGQARRLAEEAMTLGISDTGWSLATTRTVFEHRAVIVAADRKRITDGLAGLVDGAPGAGVVAGQARSLGKTVFVFPGQGSQYLGMGRGLYQRFPAFAAAFDRAADELDLRLRSPLRQVIWGSDGAALESTEFAQPALFAVQVGLAELLCRWGVTADFVMGHSVGEITAAHAAGVLSLADAARLVVQRGKLMAALPAGGAMVAVAASEAEVTPLMSAQVSLAAVNASDSVVLSGPQHAVGAVAKQLAEQGRRVRRLAVSHAFHSALMEPMVDEFSRRLADLQVHRPRTPLVSNVTGELAGADYGSARYWAEHIRNPVRFSDGVSTVVGLGAKAFIEVGPGAGLTAEQEVSVATLTAGVPEVDAVLTAAARLFTAGVEVDWAATFDGLSCRRVDLPTYAFARQRFWLTAGDSVVEHPVEPVAARLQHLGPAQWRRQLIALVCGHAAAVLGHGSGRDVDPERPFQDLGFTSMGGVELRNRLRAESALSGLSLPRTLIFDYPTPTALADHLCDQLSDHYDNRPENERIWSELRNIPIAELRRTGLLEKLLLLAGRTDRATSEHSMSDNDIDSLSPDDLIAMTLDGDGDNG
ncbi:polyketide synthase [Mycobacterium kiyosense]|uniref:Polyketide synthase n=1 Tax=Mycobacterium kiyosense TaxID=2871094 RepID=A0A9P3Q1R4_9MYCO|nr:polyketide synthase [Mycobacterium kiyosense]GLB96680.1 polyketide synthase [Mycobacterium kiyosense]GLD28129.1 polyketide synthase [Mycobacterium kiyosense]GLD34819.1 polyketide synthase [Mycobacterium kiyosense]